MPGYLNWEEGGRCWRSGGSIPGFHLFFFKGGGGSEKESQFFKVVGVGGMVATNLMFSKPLW